MLGIARLVLLHASIGALLGALLSLWIPAFDPVVVGTLSTWFAVGSGISAFIFLNVEYVGVIARRDPP